MPHGNKTVIAFLLSFSLLVPASAFGYEWKAPEGFRGWSFFYVADVRSTGEAVVVDKQPNNSYFVISLPLEAIRNVSFVRTHLRTLSIDTMVACTLLSRGRTLASREVPLFSGKGWKESVFDFDRTRFTEPVDTISLSFSHCDSVEMRDLTVRGPSLWEVFALQGFRAYNVNSLYPFKMYGYSLNLWFCGLIIVSCLGAVIFYTRKRKKGTLLLSGMIFLAFYIAMDLREVYEELAIAKTTYEDSLSAAPLEKRFYWHDNLVEFSDFIHRNVQPGEYPVNFFGDRDRYLYMRYLLYPLKLVQQDELAGVNVFSEVDSARIEGNTLLVNEMVLPGNGRAIVYTPHSCLYLAR